MKKCINAATRYNDYHKIELRADFEIVDEFPMMLSTFKGETVVDIKPNFYEQVLGPDFQLYSLYEVTTVDYSEGYKRYVVMGDNLEPLPEYSFDDLIDAEKKADEFTWEEGDEPDNYWVSDYGTLHRIAVVEEVG